MPLTVVHDRSCIGPNQCATEFPGPTGLGASFNRTLWRAKGIALSDESEHCR